MNNAQPGHGPYGCRRTTDRSFLCRWQSLEMNQRFDLPGATAGHTERSLSKYEKEKFKTRDYLSRIVLSSNIRIYRCYFTLQRTSRNTFISNGIKVVRDYNRKIRPGSRTHFRDRWGIYLNTQSIFLYGDYI